MKRRATLFRFFYAILLYTSVCFPKYLAAQATVNVTTGHQDIPAICTGCVYRTGQNLQEGTLTTTLTSNTFRQFCY